MHIQYNCSSMSLNKAITEIENCILLLQDVAYRKMELPFSLNPDRTTQLITLCFLRIPEIFKALGEQELQLHVKENSKIYTQTKLWHYYTV